VRRPILAGLAVAALAASAAVSRAANTPEAVARRIETPPALDGSVLDDPAWQAAPPISDFWQTTPIEGAAASERTEVRILYSADTLYFGVVCYDREPDRIIVSESRRDASLEAGDSFMIVIDTFRDRQNGFVFGTNPAGIEYDGQVVREGQGGNGGQGGAGGGFNLNWDAAWEVKAKAGEFGWSAEFAIPFKTLRYAKGGAQTWGLNFQRNVRRHNETAYWSPLPRQYSLFHVSAAGTLTGVEVESQRNLKLAPYALGQARRASQGESGTRWKGDLGGDLKYSLSPSLTIDATVNTDFAQVEVDEQQVNLDRFNLFFPEKRPFFLENAGQFTAGSPSEVELFFSRRIGIGPQGERVPILGGGRLSGKLWGANVGVLEMQTRAADGVAPANNFAVVRASRELGNRSGFGALFVNREATGEASAPQDRNRTWGLDGRWGLGRYGLVSGFLARTSTPGITSDDAAFQLSASWGSPEWDLSAKYTEVGSGFNPEVGFLSREGGFRKPEAMVLRSKRMNGTLGLHEIRPHVSYRGHWSPDGFQQSGFLHVDNHWEWRNGYEVHTAVNFSREGLQQPFEIYPGVVVPPGTYDHQEVQIVGITNQGAPLSLDATVLVGGFFGGRRLSLRPAVKARSGQSLNAELRWDRNQVELPAGSFTTNLIRARLSYSFSTRAFVQALVQYNDRADLSSVNLRLGWLQTANSGLFVVFNETRNTEGAVRSDRSLIVKFSRLLDLLD